MTNDQLYELLNAIYNNKDCNLCMENGTKIMINHTDNGCSISITNKDEEQVAVEREINEFNEYLKDIDDDLFTAACEYMGNETITKINNCIHSNSLETVRSGISKYKSSFKDYLENRISYYTECLNTLLR